ncbi:hypothetical protein [Rossellomorea marisflavi]|uniref:hypothetical protein n=1 Tax=Rossellomorea marisflavi TaxID=189381 RepID=UPI003F9F571C
MNTQLKQDAQSQYASFLSEVDNTLITEEAKNILLLAPTKWATYVGGAINHLITTGDLDASERMMFKQTMSNITDRIAVKMSLAQFVKWLGSAELQLGTFETHQLQLTSNHLDTYDLLEKVCDAFDL